MKDNITIFMRIVLLGSLSAFASLSLDLYVTGLPQLQRDLHTTTSNTQISITAALLGLAVGQLLVGLMSDRIGRRKPLLWGMFLFTVTSMLLAVTIQINWFIALRFVQGLVGATGVVLSLAMITDWFSGQYLVKQISINQMINAIFPIIAPIIGGVIIAYSNWRITFWLLAVVGFLLLVGTYFLLPETLPTVQAINSERLVTSIHNILKEKSLLILILVQALVMAGVFAYVSGATFIIQNRFHMPSTFSGFVFAINGLGMIVLTDVAGKLALQFGLKRVLSYFIDLGAIGALLLVGAVFCTEQLFLILGALWLVVASSGGVNSLAMTLAMRTAGKQKGLVSSLLGVSRYLFGGLVSPVVGLLGNAADRPLAIVILMTQMSALILFSIRKGRQ